MKTQNEKYELFTGFRKESNIEAKLLVGSAFKDQGTFYYKIRLMMFPGQTYYLVKNRESVDRYTIYSRIRTEGQETRFLNPIGNGILDPKLHSFMELKFPLLKAQIYMNLYPTNH
jgi:hypothetical protein